MLRKHGLKANQNKCQFRQLEIQFLVLESSQQTKYVHNMIHALYAQLQRKRCVRKWAKVELQAWQFNLYFYAVDLERVPAPPANPLRICSAFYLKPCPPTSVQRSVAWSVNSVTPTQNSHPVRCHCRCGGKEGSDISGSKEVPDPSIGFPATCCSVFCSHRLFKTFPATPTPSLP